jgi:hypothetical protein
MDETKIELPAWLPWATTACLAALVACLVELWIIEKTRNQLLRDDEALGQASLQAAQNQLEAERIVGRRELEQMRAHGAEVLSRPGEDGYLPGPWGIASWDAGGGILVVRLAGLPILGADRDYQLWIEGSGPGYPQACGIVDRSAKDDEGTTVIRLRQPIPEKYRILLIAGKKGGSGTLEEAEASGSIILASTLPRGKISN